MLEQWNFLQKCYTLRCHHPSPGSRRWGPSRVPPQPGVILSVISFSRRCGPSSVTHVPPASQVLSSVLSVVPLSFKEVGTKELAKEEETKKVATMELAPVAPNSPNRTNMAYLSLSQS